MPADPRDIPFGHGCGMPTCMGPHDHLGVARSNDPQTTHLAIEFETENAFDTAAAGFHAVSGRPREARYILPGETCLEIAAALSQAFDAISTVTKALDTEHAGAAVGALRYLHTRLDVIHEALLAVVGESPNEERHGSHRPC